MVSHFFAGSRAFDVENNFCPTINTVSREVASGFDQNFKTFVTQPLDQYKRILLSQRIAPSYFNERAVKGSNLLYHFLEGNMIAPSECVFAVAPYTPHGTAGQAYKRARPSRMGRFALNGMKNLGDA